MKHTRKKYLHRRENIIIIIIIIIIIDKTDAGLNGLCIRDITLIYDVINHGLRGSASPVLTATGFVNGRWQFSTPHRINTP